MPQWAVAKTHNQTTNTTEYENGYHQVRNLYLEQNKLIFHTYTGILYIEYGTCV